MTHRERGSIPARNEPSCEVGSIDRAPAREARTERCAERTRLGNGADRAVSGASEGEE